MDIRTLGKPLYTSDFYANWRGKISAIARENREAMEASENEIKLSILARKHLHKLSAARGMVARDAVVARERALDQRLADRGLLN